MAEEYKGTVISISLGGVTTPSDLRLLNRLLERVDAVLSHHLDVDNNTLTVYLDDETPKPEETLVKALLAAGMYPKGFSDTGFTYKEVNDVC